MRPVFRGKRSWHWMLDDGAGKGIDTVRPVRDKLVRRIRGLLRARNYGVLAAAPGRTGYGRQVTRLLRKPC